MELSLLQFITVSALTLIAIFAGYFKFKTSSSSLGKKLPPGSFGLPLIGESISFIKAQKQDKTGEWIQTRIRKYGPVFKTSLMGSKTVVFTGQAGNRFVFSGSDNGIAGNQVATAAKVLGKHSIFELSGSRHKLVRNALMSFLKPESLQRFVGEIDSLVQKQLFQELDGKDLVQMVGLMKKITFKVTCSLFFGLPEGPEKDALLEDFTIATKGLWAVPLNVPGTIFYRAMQARARISQVLTKLMQNRQKEEKNKPSQKNDIISVFLRLRDEDGEPLQEEEILDNFITLIIGSHDTTTILLSLFIRHLSTDPKTRSEVLQEQEEVVKSVDARDDGKLRWSEIQMMKHTWRVAQELMRLTPPAFGNFKCASRDTSFDGFDIPKGYKVFWVASATHMDDKIFEDPNKFDPSRFESSSKSSYPPYTYIPFGAGPRICPGIEFARIEVLLIIHHLTKNYS
ncbi:taxadiene 5-alpha hydroxylase-like [Malus sylvestris]|uniref:taxadiene 5-alpha hydroxylase-like n=1 Tax=Malus sylvestris TaxID=3752 RepID=UPI0021ACD884|nr:taxadiene 5-alpha hydroxylase-like [Malus sylvestris]